MDAIRYVTFDTTGALTGCYLQAPPEEHAGCMIVVAEELAVTWASYHANEARDGIELAPPAPPAPAKVPQQVTMRQARLALLGDGKLSLVDAAIDSLDSPERETARIEWDYSSTVLRDRPLVVLLGQELGLDEEALDQLFITAAGL
ncbi:hypothetical protein [Massilia aerilata]|uniref:Uncharacterized protein n=1 Tax=Massilia aerilata TaxID=453817 RepID=A0ABW0RXE7_9BURK